MHKAIIDAFLNAIAGAFQQRFAFCRHPNITQIPLIFDALLPAFPTSGSGDCSLLLGQDAPFK